MSSSTYPLATPTAALYYWIYYCIIIYKTSCIYFFGLKDGWQIFRTQGIGIIFELATTLHK